MQPKRAALIREKLADVAALEPPYQERQNVTKLVGREGYRLRIGDWRVLFAVSEQSLDVLTIAPRGSAYDD